MVDDVERVTPWLASSDQSWAKRIALIDRNPVKNINDLVRRIQADTRAHVPFIDPFCGGADARVLFVFLRPGPRGAMQSNFLSLANEDLTAKNTSQLIAEANLSYSRLCFWNAVPWSGPRTKKPTADDLKRGARYLASLLELLPHLRAAVIFGNQAHQVADQVNWGGVRVFKCAHTSPIVWNQHRYRAKKKAMFDAVAAAARIVQT